MHFYLIFKILATKPSSTFHYILRNFNNNHKTTLLQNNFNVNHITLRKLSFKTIQFIRLFLDFRNFLARKY
jgi:hypothetical protein